MNNYRIKLTPRAKEDIIEIGDYIADTLLEAETSQSFIKGLKYSISQLSFFPYKFPVVHDEVLSNKGVRCMSYKNYYVFYNIVETIKTVVS